jgi:spore maturation protein CgeB
VAALEADAAEYIERRHVPAFDLYLSFTGGPIIERLETRFGAQRARPLYCSVDPDLYFPREQPAAWDLGYLGTYSADRQPAVAGLLLEPAASWPDGRFVLAGPQYPTAMICPANVERIEHLAPDGHRDFYTRQRFTLNVTRRDMIAAGYSPSVRLFEAAACGTPIISDRWTGLDTFFVPGREILLADRAADVLSYLRDMPESERIAIGRCGRERVLAAHTASHRAMELEACVAEVGNGTLAAAAARTA